MRQQPQQPHTPGDFVTMRNSSNFFFILMRCWSLGSLAFIHRQFGVDALGINVLGASAVIIGAGLVSDSLEMLCFYFPAWLVMVLYRRVEAFRIEREGGWVHTQSMGGPILCQEDATTPMRTMWCDVLICGAIGGVFFQFCPAIGAFIASTGLPIVVTYNAEREVMLRRMRDMRNAQIEQRHTRDVLTGRSDS